MATIRKEFTVWPGDQDVIYGNTTSYTAIENADFYYESGSFDGTVSIYFEVVAKTSSASYPIEVGLYTSGGTLVTGSTFSFSNTGVARARTAAITLTNATSYQVRYKTTNASGFYSVYDAKIIIIQSGIISKTQSNSQLSNYTATSAGKWVDVPGATFKYVEANYTGTKAIYFEAMLKSSSPSGEKSFIHLVDSSNVEVTGSETYGSTEVWGRSRTGALTLVDGETYHCQVAGEGGATGYATNVKIIVKQTSLSGIITTECPVTVQGYYEYSTNNTSGIALGYQKFYYDESEFNGCTLTKTLNSAMKVSNASYAGYTYLTAGDTGATTTSLTYVRAEDDVTLVNATEYTIFGKSANASGTVYSRLGILIIVATFFVGGTFIIWQEGKI